MGKAMKAMKKKPISAKLAKRHAFFGKIDKTRTGLKKSDLVQTKTGKIVSRRNTFLARSHHGSQLSRKPVRNLRSRASQPSRRPRSSTASKRIELGPMTQRGICSRRGDIYGCSSVRASCSEALGINDEG